jgi:hypothetical protein
MREALSRIEVSAQAARRQGVMVLNPGKEIWNLPDAETTSNPAKRIRVRFKRRLPSRFPALQSMRVASVA